MTISASLFAASLLSVAALIGGVVWLIIFDDERRR